MPSGCSPPSRVWLRGRASSQRSSYTSTRTTASSSISRRHRSIWVLIGSKRAPRSYRPPRRFAIALGQKVPLLSEYLKLLPPSTQKEDIFDLKSALSRLPKRVVVLLDEIDRMEKDEVIVLLKVIRGISTLPNLSFVCAGDIPTIMDIADKTPLYFQKFFPVVVEVRAPDPTALRNLGIDRLLSIFDKRGWFGIDSDKEKLSKQIGE